MTKKIRAPGNGCSLYAQVTSSTDQRSLADSVTSMHLLPNNIALKSMNAERLLTRFLQYVQIDTTANDAVSDYPSSPGQLELGQLVVQQLQEMGASNVSQDRHGIVMATIPAHDRPHAPVVAFNAHFDTSPETSGQTGPSSSHT